jgi:hypothetical protein
MTATKSDPEGSVRRYLLYLENPSKLRDDTEIQKKTQAVLDAVDPIDKLKALAELEKVANVDETPLRDGFVTYAREWAETQGIPPTAFHELKVPDDVLRAAGLPTSGKRRSGARRAGAAEGRQRAKAVPVEEIKSFVLATKGTFILTDVINGVGGSQATVRKALDELIKDGKLQKLGAAPGHAGRGRAPIQYKRA